MNTSFLTLQSGRFYLLVAPRRESVRLMNALAARLALTGALYLLDGGNCIDYHAIARAVRRETSQMETILERIQAARAFTCYQLAALLAQTPATTAPLLVLDLLATFCDENAPLQERSRLLDTCLVELRRLAWQAPVLVSADLNTPALPGVLAKMLEAAADYLWRLEPVEPAGQLRLF